MITSSGAEKRRAHRRPANYEHFITTHNQTFTGPSRDLSPYGVGVYCPAPLSVKQEVEIRLSIPGMPLQVTSKGRVVHSTLSKAAKGTAYVTGIEFTESLGEKMPLLSAKGKVSRHTPSHTLAINARAEDAYRLLAEYRRYPEWTSGVKAAKVLESYPDGRGKKVEFLHDFMIHTARYVLLYTYDDQHNILSWTSAGGDDEIMSITGRYSFKDAEGKRCYATYELDITLSVIPANRLAQYITSVLMRSEMKNFRTFVEKNQTSA